LAELLFFGFLKVMHGGHSDVGSLRSAIAAAVLEKRTIVPGPQG